MADHMRPVHIMSAGSREDRGEDARETAFLGAIAVSDLVKTTLGPKGMDKILVSMGNQNEMQVTNDGATILKSVYLDNAAAKVLVDVSRVQDDEVGDGTTSVCVLSGELLREAERLVRANVHPQLVMEGYRKASAIALDALEASAQDHGDDAAAFRADLLNIARTTLSSKILSQEKDKFAEMAVDAVLRLKGSGNLEAIQIIKKRGGTLKDSFLEEGFILEKSIGVGQPKRIENARVLLANTPMDTDKVKIFGSKVKTDSLADQAQIEAAERKKMLAKCERILATGCNVFINRQLIYNLPEEYFADHGCMAIEHADFDGVERLALVLGAEIASTFDEPAGAKLGECAVIEEIMIGEDRVLRFAGVALGEACSIVLRGSSQHVLEEADRSLHDALCVLTQTVKESRTVLGGGCSEMLMAHAVDEAAAVTPGKVSLAMTSFAKALRQLPTIISDNAGLDSAELVTELRACHARGESTKGLDLYQGKVVDVRANGTTESYKVKSQVVASASEAAEMILRIDEIVRNAPRERQADPRLG